MANMSRNGLQVEDLPAWMQPRRRVIDWGQWIVLGFCLIVVLPLLFRLGLPLNTEAELYQFRSSEIKQIVHSGTLFSRWAPNFHYKLGSPLFNYLAPLPHYLSGYFEALTDTGSTTSIKLFLYLSIFAAGTGMYQFVRQRWGAPSGVVAAVTYLLSTPLSYSLPYLSGDLGLLMALGALPWVLYALDRLMFVPGGRSMIFASIVLTIFILTDTRIVVLGGAVIGANLISLNWRSDVQKDFYRPVALVIGCALALSAFYWLPAILERDQIHWIHTGSDPNAGPIPLAELIAPIPRYDINLQNPPPHRAIGGGTLLLAILGTGATLRYRRTPDVGEFLFVGVMAAVGALPLVYELWPSADMFQPLLPYHAVLIATFCFSVISAQSIQWIEQHKHAAYWPAILVGVAGLFALPSLYPPNWQPELTEPDSLSALRTELAGYHSGTFRTGALLPANVSALPQPLPDLLQQVETNQFQRLIVRNIASNLPANEIEQGLLHSRYIGIRRSLFGEEIQPVDIEYYTFNYPGWTVSIDNERPPVQSSDEGFIQFTVPPDASELSIWFEGTSLRNFAWCISLLGLGGLFIVQRVSNSSTFVSNNKRASISIPQKLLLRPQAGATGFVLGLYLCGALFMSQYPDWILPRSRLGRIEGATPVADSFVPQDIRLMAYQVDSSRIQSDETIEINLYWQVNVPLTVDWQSEVQLLQNKQVVMWQGNRYPGNIPTSRWETGRYIRDSFTIPLPEGAKSGTYAIDVKLMPCNRRDLKPCDHTAQIGLEGEGFITSLPSLQIP